jgi:hypothetical protein
MAEKILCLTVDRKQREEKSLGNRYNLKSHTLMTHLLQEGPTSYLSMSSQNSTISWQPSA